MVNNPPASVARDVSVIPFAARDVSVIPFAARDVSLIPFAARDVSVISFAARDVSLIPFAARDVSLIPGSGRSPAGGNGSQLQDSCVENPMDRGTWWATVHGVTNSQAQMK